jgi:NAD(P)H dehydrogenase (quinone)
MAIEKVIVFGATGMQGRQQPRELLKHGYKVRVVSRKLEQLDGPDFEGTEKMVADYDDPASIERAVEGVDAIFYQAQSMGDVERCDRQTETVRKAAERRVSS